MKNKAYKVVFTLTSGKSIVYTMLDENALTVFEDWKRFKAGNISEVSDAENDRTEDEKLSLERIKNNIIEITKMSEGRVSEKLGIDLSKIDAVQIEDMTGPSKD